MGPFKILLAGLAGFIFFKFANFSVKGKKSNYSPSDFDFNYWISDRGNWNDLVLGLIAFGVIARYKEVLFTAFPDNFLIAFLLPYKDTEFLYFSIGFLMTFILMLVRMLIDKINIIVKALKKNNK